MMKRIYHIRVHPKLKIKLGNNFISCNRFGCHRPHRWAGIPRHWTRSNCWFENMLCALLYSSRNVFVYLTSRENMDIIRLFDLWSLVWIRVIRPEGNSDVCGSKLVTGRILIPRPGWYFPAKHKKRGSLAFSMFHCFFCITKFISKVISCRVTSSYVNLESSQW